VPPSITTWTRLEPRPRAPSLEGTLSARVRDPLWFLTRQWQLGEFRGEDAGSPAWVHVAGAASPFTGWTADGRTVEPWGAADPLEDLVEREPFTPDLALRVELGQVFERLLAGAAVPSSVIDAIRLAYALPPLPEEVRPLVEAIARGERLESTPAPLVRLGPNLQETLDARRVSDDVVDAFGAAGISLSKRAAIEIVVDGVWWAIDDRPYGRVYAAVRNDRDERIWVYLDGLPELAGDAEAARFRQVCAGRSIDGYAVYAAASEDLPLLPTLTLGSPADADAVTKAGVSLVTWVRRVYGDVGVADPAAWRPERLEYRLSTVATSPDGGTTTLTARPGWTGSFDWYAFDRASSQPGTSTTDAIGLSIIPGHVRFRGMPNARWWDFEAGTAPFGEMLPDKREVAKLVLMDFMLVHGNDWFAIPLDQRVGTLCRIDSLIVHDVFGVATLVERADAAPAAPGELWTLFSTAVEGTTDEVADFFLVPPSARTAAQIAPAVEEVRFLRDEAADLVWAVEETTENAVGEPWPGHERDQARKAQRDPAPPVTTSGGAPDRPPLRYVVQTPVPESWIPFVPVLDERTPDKIWLERMFMPRGRAANDLVLPAGRILRPTNVPAGEPYRVFEEEVPREGARVTRHVVRSRWIDGSTHVWIARRKSVGVGEGSSGLRFDLAVPAGRSPDDV
jgi:hypothetical protein